eukprot:360365-Chlamydomonas_euryale.AAC.3
MQLDAASGSSMRPACNFIWPMPIHVAQCSLRQLHVSNMQTHVDNDRTAAIQMLVFSFTMEFILFIHAAERLPWSAEDPPSDTLQSPLYALLLLYGLGCVGFTNLERGMHMSIEWDTAGASIYPSQVLFVRSGVPFVTAPGPLLDPLYLATLNTGIPGAYHP